MTDEIRKRLERSSFGEPSAVRARRSVPAETAAKILARTKALDIKAVSKGDRRGRGI